MGEPLGNIDKSAGSPHPCAVCSGKATIAVTSREGGEKWYCARHVPPPSTLSDAQRQEWEAYTALIWFVRDNNRMPSLDPPAERQILLRAIHAAPGTEEFRREYSRLQRLANHVMGAPRRYKRVSMILDGGCLLVVALVAATVLAALTAGVIWAVNHFRA